MRGESWFSSSDEGRKRARRQGEGEERRRHGLRVVGGVEEEDRVRRGAEGDDLILVLIARHVPVDEEARRLVPGPVRKRHEGEVRHAGEEAEAEQGERHPRPCLRRGRM